MAGHTGEAGRPPQDRAFVSRTLQTGPSFNVSGLAEVTKSAQFPIWVFGQGQLLRYYALGRADREYEYTVVLDSRLRDGRRFTVTESKDLPDPGLLRNRMGFQTPDPARVTILNPNVDINGHDGVLYQTRVNYATTPPPGSRESVLTLRWHADGTDLSLSEDLDQPALSREEIIAIAKAFRKLER